MPPSSIAFRVLLLAPLMLMQACKGSSDADKLPYEGSAALILSSADQPRRNPADDAAAQAAMEEALVSHGFTVTRQLNATRHAALQSLEQLAAGPGSRPRDRVFVYVRARGITQITPAGRATGHLAMADTPQTAPILPPGALQALSVQELDAWARRLPARHVFIALDACFSGGPITLQGAPPDRLPADPLTATVHYLVAGDSVVCSAPNTLFAKTLARALTRRGPAASGLPIVTGSELSAEVQDGVSESTLGQQLPRSGKSQQIPGPQGEVLFLRSAKSLGAES